MAESKWQVWDVKGTFIIPGTRDKGSIGPVRIGHFTKRQASEHLSEILNEKFAKKLRDERKFNRDFAMLNLQWVEFNRPRNIPPIQEEVKAS